MTATSLLHSILDWLRAGYPDGVPGPDRVPLLSLLRATPLTEEQIREVIAHLTEDGSAAVADDTIDVDEIEAFVYAVARQITRNAPLSIAVMKEELRLLASAHAITPELFERIQGLRRIVYDSNDYKEGLTAFREKRKPQFRGD